MNWRNIFTVYRKELIDSLRDRRTLISTIEIPTVVMPTLIFGMGKLASTVVSKAKAEVPRVMIIGGEDSPTITARLRDAKKFTVIPAQADWRDQISEKKV